MLFISIPLEFLLNSYARNIVNIGRSLRLVTLYIGEINNGISWKCWYVWIGTQYFIIFCDNNVNTMPLFQNTKLFIFFFISFNFTSPLFQVIRTQHLKVRLFYEVVAVQEIQYSISLIIYHWLLNCDLLTESIARNNDTLALDVWKVL